MSDSLFYKAARETQPPCQIFFQQNLVLGCYPLSRCKGEKRAILQPTFLCGFQGPPWTKTNAAAEPAPASSTTTGCVGAASSGTAPLCADRLRPRRQRQTIKRRRPAPRIRTHPERGRAGGAHSNFTCDGHQPRSPAPQCTDTDPQKLAQNRSHEGLFLGQRVDTFGKRWRTAQLRGLLVGIGHAYQGSIGPGTTDKRQRHWQPAHLPGGHGDMRVASNRCGA